jgi:hypothetical protein
MKTVMSGKTGKGYFQKKIIEKDLEEKKGSGFFEQFPHQPLWQKREEKLPQRLEFTVFRNEDYEEKYVIPQEIKRLTEEIRKEIAAIKQSNKALLSQVADIEKTTLQSLPDKPGIYHVRFLEILLSFLRNLRAKVGEAKTWLAAMQTKRKKRGSLFLALSKKKGTQYSLSQELQTARGVM